MNSLNFNLYNVLILLGIIHGIIFSLILFFNPKLKSKTNIFLALTILTLCLSNLQYLLYDIGIVGSFYAEYLFVPFEFLILPMFYFFVKKYLNTTFRTIHSYVVIIPFMFMFLCQLITNLFDIDRSIVSILSLFFEYGAACFSIILIILIFMMIINYEKSILQVDDTIIPKTTSWLKRLLILGLILCFMWFFSLFIFKDYMGEGLYPFYPLWIGISILIYWIAYSSIFQNSIYKERREIRNKIIHIQENSKTQKIVLDIGKLSENINPNKFTEINKLILEKRLYLKPKLSLKTISKHTNLSEGYLSQIINSNTNKNFNEYINALRIENAKKLLINNEYSKYTITAIGLESGFNTKASFYNAFKKHTGNTPNTYKKLVQNL